MAPVKADLSVTSLRTLKLNLLLRIANIIEPKAPANVLLGLIFVNFGPPINFPNT